MKKKKAFVICCNDAVEHVVIDNEALAYKELRERSDSDIFKETSIRYWHIHEVDYTKPKGFFETLFDLLGFGSGQSSIGSLK
jgi:hypothetical protein